MSTDESLAGLTVAAPTKARQRIAFRPHQLLPLLLLPEGMPLQVLMDAASVRVPNTQAWFQGVVSQRGNLLPVFDLAGWAGLASEPGSRVQVVAIGLGAQACAMLSTSTPTLVTIDSDTIDSKIVASDDGALSPYLGTSYASALGRAREFDIQRWLAVETQQISGNAATNATR